jgi:hypothetical protein
MLTLTACALLVTWALAPAASYLIARRKGAGPFLAWAAAAAGIPGLLLILAWPGRSRRNAP